MKRNKVHTNFVLCYSHNLHQKEPKTTFPFLSYNIEFSYGYTSLVGNYSSLKRCLLTCLELKLFDSLHVRDRIQDSFVFLIARCKCRISGTAFRFPCQWNLDSGFLELNYGFQSPGFRTKTKDRSALWHFCDHGLITWFDFKGGLHPFGVSWYRVPRRV